MACPTSGHVNCRLGTLWRVQHHVNCRLGMLWRVQPHVNCRLGMLWRVQPHVNCRLGMLWRVQPHVNCRLAMSWCVQPQVNGIPSNRRLAIGSTRSDICGATNSTWSDIFIESTLMRYGNSKGGLTGITLNDMGSSSIGSQLALPQPTGP